MSVVTSGNLMEVHDTQAVTLPLVAMGDSLTYKRQEKFEAPQIFRRSVMNSGTPFWLLN